MYSKAFSDNPRAGFAKQDSEDGQMVLPPRYSGVRFMKTKRSDGRDRVFERNLVSMAEENRFTAESSRAEEDGKRDVFSESIFENGAYENKTESVEKTVGIFDETAEEQRMEIQEEELQNRTAAVYRSTSDSITKKSFSQLFGKLGEDDFLIIALILILAGQHGENNRDIILLLALLLCIR